MRHLEQRIIENALGWLIGAPCLKGAGRPAATWVSLPAARSWLGRVVVVFSDLALRATAVPGVPGLSLRAARACGPIHPSHVTPIAATAPRVTRQGSTMKWIRFEREYQATGLLTCKCQGCLGPR